MRYLPLLLLLTSCWSWKKDKISINKEDVLKIVMNQPMDSFIYELNFGETAAFIEALNNAEPRGPLKFAKRLNFRIIQHHGDPVWVEANDDCIFCISGFKHMACFSMTDSVILPHLAHKVDSLKNVKIPKKVFSPIDSARIAGSKERIHTKINTTPCTSLPCCDCEKAIIYEIQPQGEGGPEDVFKERTDKSKILSKSELIPFLALLNNPQSYGNGSAGCHDPRIGMVCYNADNHPCSYLTICLECNNLMSRPDFRDHYKPEQLRGFSKATRQKLRAIFANWGFPDNNKSEMFDE